jgi:2-haloacid dehalogenase
MLEHIKALTFDTGGTLLDWHHGISRALASAGARRGLQADWPTITNEYRRRSLQAMLDAEHPTFTIDDVHREMLDTVVAECGLQAFTAEDREAVWRTWHARDAWPNVVPALARLRAKYVVASFTILTTSLVVDVSRHNNITWDCLISCEMIGIYKPRLEAYQSVAKWLALEPHEILMVACHNFDLMAARAACYRSAFVRRPTEWRPSGPPDPVPNPAHDIVVDTFFDLAQQLGA